MNSKQLHIDSTDATEFMGLILNAMEKRFEKIYEQFAISEKNQEEELLTVEETIKFLKCSKQALWNWRKNQILPSYRLGNRVYYKKSDILKKLIKQE